MKKVLILGGGPEADFIVSGLKDSGNVSEICIAARDKSKCDEIRNKYSGGKIRISSARVDLENQEGTRMMLSITRPDLIVNLVPAQHSITVMNLALEIDADYIDGDLYEWSGGDLLSRQFELFGEYREKGRMAVCGCALNPGILTSIVRNSLKNGFTSVESADILEINLSEDDPGDVDAVYIEEGEKKTGKALSLHIETDFEEFGKTTLYLADNPVTQDFLKEIPEVGNVKCYVSYERENEEDFTEELGKLGMLSEEPLEIFPGVRISPKEFWDKLQASRVVRKELAGPCGAGVIIKGTDFGNLKRRFVYLTGNNDESLKEYGMTSEMLFDSYAMLAGIKLICGGKWLKAGVFTPSAFDPELLINGLRSIGLYLSSKDLPFEINSAKDDSNE